MTPRFKLIDSSINLNLRKRNSIKREFEIAFLRFLLVLSCLGQAADLVVSITRSSAVGIMPVLSHKLNTPQAAPTLICSHVATRSENSRTEIRVRAPSPHRATRAASIRTPFAGPSGRVGGNASKKSAVLNQGDQGENLIPPSLILIPDIPDIPEVPWVPSGA